MMIKKILSLALCVLMLISCLSGCAKKSEEDTLIDAQDKASAEAMTLSMYLMSEGEISAAQEEKIEDAVNAITEKSFKTRLDLHFYTKDTYYQALETAFAKQGGAEDVKNDAETEVLDAWEVLFPDSTKYQVDMFYIGGEEKFSEYVGKGYLAKLESSTLKGLVKDISASYLDNIKALNGSTYAVPTNAEIGEYKYLLLNKQVLKDMGHDTAQGMSKFTSLTCEATQNVLAREKSLYSSLGADGLAVSGIKYFATDSDGKLVDKFSVLAGDYDVKSTYGENASYIKNLGSVLDTEFVEQFKVLKSYKANGYFKDKAALESGEVAVAYLCGGSEVKYEYDTKYKDNYELIVVEQPRLDTNQLYSDMFAVNAKSDTARCMQVITLLNTDAEFRNIILYGVEGYNFELVDSSEYSDADGAIAVVKRKNTDYLMSVEKTGNELITYVLDSDNVAGTKGGNPLLAELSKQQNIDSLVDITLGLKTTFVNGKSVNLKVDSAKFARLSELSESVLTRLWECSLEDYDATVEALRAEIDANEDFAALTENVKPPKNKDGSPAECGFVYLYEQWASKLKINK